MQYVADGNTTTHGNSTVTRYRTHGSSSRSLGIRGVQVNTRTKTRQGAQRAFKREGRHTAATLERSAVTSTIPKHRARLSRRPSMALHWRRSAARVEERGILFTD